MCGICGKTRDSDASATTAMNAVMRHRGPDDEGVHVDRDTGVALGARRLSIIDVQGGHQPLSNEAGDVWAALNGEIYNHPSLQDVLRRAGHTLATRTDTEVLVHLYEDYGDELVHALEGMFSFAVWDSRRRRLLVARDRFGEKPLFYAERDGVLTFASELDALAAGAGLPRELDSEAVDAFFVFGYVPGPGTILADARQLPPGHLMVWDQAERRLEVRPYWQPMRNAAERREPLEEVVAETEALLEASVRSRMISDVPLGVFLSGGTDSTLIAALAARQSTSSVKTFTIGYDVGTVNETDAARETAAAIGAEHHELILSEADVAARVPPLLASLDQPHADQSLVSLHAVAELARRDVTVAIGGEGADELFGGYPRYRWLERAERIERRVPAGVAARASAAVTAARIHGRARRLADVLAPKDQLERHLDWVTFGRRADRGRLYGPRLRHLHDSAGLAAGLARRLNGDGPGEEPPESTPARLMRLDQLDWLPDDVLQKADRAGMLVSLEIRTPFLNRELAELAAAIPADVHMADGGKALLRHTLARVLPGLSRQRPKTAFRVPIADWLRGPLAPAMAEQPRCGRLYSDGWFDRDAVAGIAAEHREGRRDWSTTLWPLLALGLWLDSHAS